MFEHLRIRDANPVLPEATLRNLGRVNVICGKNNSGKSATLSAIANKVTRGRTFDRTMFENPKVRPTIWVPKGAGSKNSVGPDRVEAVTEIGRFWDKYRAQIARVLRGNQIWYADEEREFRAAVEEAARCARGKYLFESVDIDFSPVFGHIFDSFIHPALIPPIRQIGTRTASVNDKEPDVEPSGRRLLAKLSWDKNQPRQSRQYQLFKKVRSSFEQVSSGHTFNITQAMNSELLLRFSYRDHDEIEADSCGLGLQDLLVILYFALSDAHNVLLIEEPENHMHPEMQKKLLKFLKEETTKQYFITTHSNLFLNSTYVDRVFFSEFSDGRIHVKDATSRAEALHGLGYAITDNLVSDLILLVEGSGDKIFFEQFLAKMNLDAKYRINIWILGGNEMANQDLSSFRENHKVLAIVDRDDDSKVAREAFAKACRKYGIPLHILSRYSLESYFSPNGLNGAFNAAKPKLPEIANLSPTQLKRKIANRPIWKSLADTPTRQSTIKKMLKRNVLHIAQNMEIGDLDGTDLKTFLDKIEATLAG